MAQPQPELALDPPVGQPARLAHEGRAQRRDAIEEGRALYKRRVAPELYPKNFYDRALVDILIKAKGHIKSRIW